MPEITGKHFPTAHTSPAEHKMAKMEKCQGKILGTATVGERGAPPTAGIS
jgi:hypothetical protein